jgi:hypothetical protein
VSAELDGPHTATAIRAPLLAVALLIACARAGVGVTMIPRVIQFERLARSVRARVAFTGHNALRETYEVLGAV